MSLFEFMLPHIYACTCFPDSLLFKCCGAVYSTAASREQQYSSSLSHSVYSTTVIQLTVLGFFWFPWPVVPWGGALASDMESRSRSQAPEQNMGYGRVPCSNLQPNKKPWHAPPFSQLLLSRSRSASAPTCRVQAQPPCARRWMRPCASRRRTCSTIPASRARCDQRESFPRTLTPGSDRLSTVYLTFAPKLFAFK